MMVSSCCWSLALAPVVCKASGTPLLSTSSVCLVPDLARSVGLGPVVAAAAGGGHHRAVNDDDIQVQLAVTVEKGQQFHM